ncbi:MAG: hypothetical protein IJ859_06785 [Synergistaceae bacterium]|nr:hypothetical protein [Synergistaceae bacterium]
MYSFSGLVDGNTITTSENLHQYEGRQVIITILDEPVEIVPLAVLDSAKRKAAVKELSGMWESHNADETVDEMVRKLRRGRRFDF